MIKLQKGKKYHIKWHDTLAIESWCNLESIEAKAQECSSSQESVGFYVADLHGYYILAGTTNKADGMLPYANIVFIPKGCVKKIISF